MEEISFEKLEKLANKKLKERKAERDAIKESKDKVKTFNKILKAFGKASKDFSKSGKINIDIKSLLK